MHIIVTQEMIEDRTHVSVHFLKDERKLSVGETMMALADAISLLIRTSPKIKDDLTDYDTMKYIMSYMEKIFIDPSAFEDADGNGDEFNDK